MSGLHVGDGLRWKIRSTNRQIGVYYWNHRGGFSVWCLVILSSMRMPGMQTIAGIIFRRRSKKKEHNVKIATSLSAETFRRKVLWFVRHSSVQRYILSTGTQVQDKRRVVCQVCHEISARNLTTVCLTKLEVSTFGPSLLFNGLLLIFLSSSENDHLKRRIQEVKQVSNAQRNKLATWDWSEYRSGWWKGSGGDVRIE